MNRINVAFNCIVVAMLVGVGGYVTFHSSGFGLVPGFSEPDDSWFHSAVLERSQPVVVKFGASWCGPCRMIEPELDRLASSGRVAVVRVDVDRNRELARHYRVSSIPAVFLFHHGSVVAHRVGYADSNELKKWVSQHASQ
ncbi:MAG TPA: thioredoxin family protein [Pirellulales bacterium]|jgi:thioredoxin|nr:thioredoxin family protein [Pirellulales bacterium]